MVQSLNEDFPSQSTFIERWVEIAFRRFCQPEIIFMFFFILLGGMNLIINAEILPEQNGFGYEDGLIFKDVVYHFPDVLLDKSIPRYYIQRLLPSIIVHYGFTLFNIPLSDAAILSGFRIYNLILLLVAVWIWGKTLDEFNLSQRGRWLAYFGLFVNVFVMKLYFYRPVFTDQTALLLGILLLYFFLKEKWVGFWLTVVAGAFTWQTTILYGVVLYLFPAKKSSDTVPRLSRYYLHILLSGLACLFLLWTLFDGIRGNLEEKWWIHDRSVIYLSIAITVIYLFQGLRRLLDFPALYDIKNWMRQIISYRMLISAAVFITITLIVNHFGINETEFEYSRLFIKNAATKSIGAPGIFLVAHVVYFGPIFLLTLFFWKSIVRNLYKYGPGLVLFTTGNLVLSLTSESRFLTQAFPFLVAFTVQAADGIHFERHFLPAFSTSALLFSKVWYRINIAWQAGFPQAYFMNYGPWMSPEMYTVQGCAVLLTAILLMSGVRTGET